MRKVDQIIVKPSIVTTQMTGFNTGKKSVTTGQCTYGTFMDLGHLEETGGAFKHQLFNIQHDVTPAAYCHYDREKSGK